MHCHEEFKNKTVSKQSNFSQQEYDLAFLKKNSAFFRKIQEVT
jgi:hypothetical protein